MKNTFKYFTAISLAVSLTFLTACCGKENDAPGFGAETEGQGGFLSEYVDLGEGISDMALHYGMQQLGDELCYISYAQDKGQTLEKYSLTDGSRSEISFTWLESAKRQNISKFAFAEDGGIYAVVYQASEPNSSGNFSVAIQLSKFDVQGNQTFAVDISEQVNEEFGSGADNLLAADDQGRIYIAGRTKVWLYDLQEGTEPDYRGKVSVCSDEEEESRISAVICGKDGRVYVCIRKGESVSSAAYSLVQIDFDNVRVGAVYEDLPCAGGIAPGIEKDFLVHDNSDVYEYDLASRTMEPVLNWMENNVVGAEVQYFGALEDGRVYAVTKEWGKADSGLMILSRNSQDGQTEQKEEITLANLYFSGILQKAVVDFNKSSDKYKIVLKEYDEYQQLFLDITTDNCPDILDLNSLNVEQFAAMGIFEDLSAYLDNSQVLDRSAYLDNVLEAYTFEGRLVTIPSTFSVQTIIAGADNLKKVFGADFEGGWTVEELMAYADANPEAELFDRVSRSSLMYYLMMYGKDSFIDWDAGKCCFDSDLFKSVLKFVGRFPDEASVKSASTAARIEAGEVLLAAASLYRFDGLQLYEEVFGGEAVCVGFPTADGSVGCALYANDALAILAGSSHKEGAWEFIESFLADEDYGASDDFVANRTRLEKNVAVALAAEYATYDDGTLVVDKDGRNIISNYTTSTITFMDGWTFTSHVPTEEEVQEVFAIIGKAVRRPDRESDRILNIINEEAGAFYQGQKSVEEVAEIIQNRVQLYIDENKS